MCDFQLSIFVYVSCCSFVLVIILVIFLSLVHEPVSQCIVLDHFDFVLKWLVIEIALMCGTLSVLAVVVMTVGAVTKVAMIVM